MACHAAATMSSQRQNAQREEDLLESALHYSAPATTCTHGGTSAQPGPRKKVPMTISTRLATTKMVKSQSTQLAVARDGGWDFGRDKE